MYDDEQYREPQQHPNNQAWLKPEDKRIQFNKLDVNDHLCEHYSIYNNCKEYRNVECPYDKHIYIGNLILNDDVEYANEFIYWSIL